MVFRPQNTFTGPTMKHRFLPACVAFAALAFTAQGAPEPAPGPEVGRSIEERQNVKKLFQSMNAGAYHDCDFPNLVWADIPDLLKIADSTTVLRTFPRNSLSSQRQPECTEGMVALWLVEGIRQGGRYPSLNAPCFKQGVKEKNWSKASEKNHAELTKVYRAWWERVRHVDREKASKIDPLRGTTLHWY